MPGFCIVRLYVCPRKAAFEESATAQKEEIAPMCEKNSYICTALRR